MLIPIEDVKLEDCKNVPKFVEYLKDKTGSDSISAQTIHYQMREGGLIDYVEWSNTKLVVMTERSKSFVPRGTEPRKTHLMKKQQI